MASTEFPLKTNKELTRILNVYNGSNEVEIILDVDVWRILYRWIETSENGSLDYIYEEKNPDPPHGYILAKGYAYCVLNRSFVEYATRDPKALDLLKWTENTYSPDEL